MRSGLISTLTLDVVIETSLVSPIETKQVQKVDLNWTCFSVHTATEWSNIVPASVHTRTERYNIISFQFLVHFSILPNFWACFGTDCLIFFHTYVNAVPLRTTFWNRPKLNSMILCSCEQSLNLTCSWLYFNSQFLNLFGFSISVSFVWCIL